MHHDLTKKNARDCARHLFNLKHRPDGLFVVHDPAAIQAMLVAREMKINIPDEIAVVGFSNEPISDFIEPGLTTLAQPLEDIGKESVEMLLRQINEEGPEIKHELKVLKTTLIVRGSSQKKKRSRAKA